MELARRLVAASAIGAAALTTVLAGSIGSVGASIVDTTSTEGIHVETVPAGGVGTPVAINDDAWVATTGSLWPAVGYPDIDVAPGVNFTVYDLNDAGTIVGSYLSGSFDRGFVRLADGSFPTVGAPGAGQGQWFRALADDGSIIGRFLAPAGTCGNASTGMCDFLLTPDGSGGYVSTILERAGGGQLFVTNVVALDGGEVVVLSADTVWSAAGSHRTLAADGVSTSVSAFDANANGAFVGQGLRASGTVGLHWASDTATPTVVPPLDGHTHAQLVAINDAGLVVGWSGTSPDPVGSAVPFVWDATTGTTTLLGSVPGETWAVPVDIDDTNLIVGHDRNGALVWDLDGDHDYDAPPEIVSVNESGAVTEGETWTIDLDIADAENDPYTVTFEPSTLVVPDLVTDPPAGLVWDPATDRVSWTTARGDAGLYAFTIVIAQSDLPANRLEHPTFAQVLEAPPQPTTLEPIPAQTLTVGDMLYLTPVVGGDPPIAFGLFGGPADAAGPPPTGAAVDPDTGIITWTATADQVGVSTLTLVAWTDVVGGPGDIAGEPHTTFTVDVSAAPEPVVIELTDRIVVADSVVVRPPVVLSFSDSIVVADSVVVRPPVVIELTDSIVVADSVVVRPPVEVILSDVVAVVDSLTIDMLPVVETDLGDVIGVIDDVAVVVTGDLNEIDPDDDGIATAVDGRMSGKSFVDESTTFSNLFTDQHRPGSATSHAWGRVTKRGGALTIADADDIAWGVRVTVGGARGVTESTVSVCDAGHVVHVGSGTSVRFRCGSLWAAVDAGSVLIETSDGATIRVPAGSTVYLVDDGGVVRVEAVVGPLTITNQWESYAVAAGEFVVDPGLDTTPPNITATDVTATLPAGTSSAVVTYPDPTATDNSGTVTVTCVPPSGSTFAVGSVDVTCTAADPSGNTTSVTFTLNVLAGAPPSPTLPPTGGTPSPVARWAAVLLAAGSLLALAAWLRRTTTP